MKLKYALCLSRMPAVHLVEQKTHSASSKLRVTLAVGIADRCALGENKHLHKSGGAGCY